MNSRISNISNEELLYLAGFLDGDGSLIAQIVRRRDYVNKFQIRLSVQFTQHTKRRYHLEAIKKTLGAGTLRNVKSKKKKTEVSHYVLTDTPQVLLFLNKIAPYLRLKKKQAYLIIRIIEELPTARKSVETFVQLCKLVDQVAQLNDSKKKTIDARVVAQELLGHEI